MRVMAHPDGLQVDTEDKACVAFDYLVKTTVSVFAKRDGRPYGAVCREDLLQDGRIGLIRAVRAFDGARGAEFETFAILCIRREILNGRKRMGRRPRKMIKPSHEHYSVSKHDDKTKMAFPELAFRSKRVVLYEGVHFLEDDDGNLY